MFYIIEQIFREVKQLAFEISLLYGMVYKIDVNFVVSQAFPGREKEERSGPVLD